MLATVKNAAVKMVFPIWAIVEIPYLCFPNIIEHQSVKEVKSKFKSEKNEKNKHKNNIVLKGNEKKSDYKQTVMWHSNINLPILHICTSETLYNSLITKYIKITYLFLRYYYPCGLIIFLYKWIWILRKNLEKIIFYNEAGENLVLCSIKIN